MKSLISYIKYTYKWILIPLAFTIAMGFILFVNQVEAAEIGYGILVMGFLTLLIYGYDFWKYLKKKKQLKQFAQSIQFGMQELPEKNWLLEEEYGALLTQLYEQKTLENNEIEARFRNMTEYYSMWVHQIKTPIAAMHLLLQSRREHVETDERMLEEELFRIEQYVEMALQYLRLDAKSTDFVLQKQNLDAIVREAIRKYAKIFIRKKISLHYDGVAVTVLSDEKWLEFVVEQILSNAVKYTTKGSISIYVEDANGVKMSGQPEDAEGAKMPKQPGDVDGVNMSKQAEDADGVNMSKQPEGADGVRRSTLLEREVFLVIEDTGIGIRAEDLPRVFEKGYTGYNGHSDKSSTGIGLYLCYEILKKLSHTITITSEVGKGTKVKIGFSANLTTM